MAPPERPRRLVVNADDFGGSHSINQAVIRAHRDGILTSASLMVNGEAVAEAVELAREHSRLGVGLHLTLICGRSCLGAGELAGLVDERRRFSDQPVLAGLRYYFQRRNHAVLEQEVAAQFERFRATGLGLDHVNGHLHFHLHPTVLRMLMRHGEEWGIRAMRLTREPLGLSLRLGGGRY
jgi:chitin disaccharide deacetylase